MRIRRSVNKTDKLEEQRLAECCEIDISLKTQDTHSWCSKP